MNASILSFLKDNYSKQFVSSRLLPAELVLLVTGYTGLGLPAVICQVTRATFLVDLLST
jgi:hypothetical protein